VCLAVPGRVVEWLDTTRLFASARVDFGGIQRHVNMACVPEAKVDEYVLVHAGIAISRIDREQAERVWQDLATLGIARMSPGSDPGEET
jgi:hydrogenase expression/formation protein HypC